MEHLDRIITWQMCWLRAHSSGIASKENTFPYTHWILNTCRLTDWLSGSVQLIDLLDQQQLRCVSCVCDCLVCVCVYDDDDDVIRVAFYSCFMTYALVVCLCCWRINYVPSSSISSVVVGTRLLTLIHLATVLLSNENNYHRTSILLSISWIIISRHAHTHTVVYQCRSRSKWELTNIHITISSCRLF